MPTPLTYNTPPNSLQSVLLAATRMSPSPYTVVPPDFAEQYPRAISYAESRICAEIPLLANRTQNTQLATTVANRQLDLTGMTNPLVVMERLALISPALTTNPRLGTRWQFIKTTLDFIDAFWPNEQTTLDPSLADNVGRYWAPLNTGSTSAAYTGSSSIIVLAPTPNGPYTAECTGLFQPPPLSAANQTTYLSTVFPDLLTAACMVFLEGALKKNFGAASDDPRQALSWGNQYQVLKAACEFEEARRRGLAPDIPRPPAPVAAP